MLVNYRLGHATTKWVPIGKFGSILRKLTLRLLKLFIYKPLSAITGSFVPYSCSIGRRVCFRHGLFGIFISQDTVIGDDLIILHQVTIGSNYDTSKNPGAPTIGDKVFIGAGAKIIGKVKVGNNVRVGANAIVISDVTEGATCVAPKCRIIEKCQK